MSSAHISRVSVALLAWLAAACIAAPLGSEKSGLADGARCKHDEDCRSHGCNHNLLCAHSACDCPGETCTDGGEASPDCADGWVCVYYKSVLHDVGEFFGSKGDLNGGTCQPTCAATCPEHYICGGQLCKADNDWPNPVPSVSWSGAVEGNLGGSGHMQTVKLEKGKQVTLTASATSPADIAITRYSWTIVTDSGQREPMEAQTVDVVLDGSYARAELVVGDADGRTGYLQVTFEGCGGSGAQCGYQGSGCCNGCDADKKFCL